MDNENPSPEGGEEASPPEGGEGEGASDSTEIERVAVERGWKPKEQWKGDQSTWVDAKTYVDRSENFIPVLRADREKLKGQLNVTDQRLRAAEAELANTRTQLAELKTFREEMSNERRERRKAEIGIELRAAREAGDDVRVAELQNELGEVVKPPATALQTPPPSGPHIQPWVRGFLETNSEFFQNPRKVALFNQIVMEKRQGGDQRVGETDGVAFLNEARTEVDTIMGGNAARRNAPPRAEGSRPPSNGGGSGTKGYDSLPPEAKRACDAREGKFVGPEKAFKTQAEWRTHYAQEYYSS